MTELDNTAVVVFSGGNHQICATEQSQDYQSTISIASMTEYNSLDVAMLTRYGFMYYQEPVGEIFLKMQA